MSVQPSGTDASLRGISAVSSRVAWASGSNGTVLRTSDGGAAWRQSQVTGALDFRAIQALDQNTAWILSSGNGDKSTIYRTIDGGEHWKLLYTNPDPQGFWDAMAFWDAAHGIVLGDPVDGRFAIFTTADGGETWNRRRAPDAQAGEGAFAASNTCLIVAGKNTAWFVTGASRVFRSDDGGESWHVSAAPIRHDSSTSGIFSLAFSDAQHGVAVGGDYTKPDDDTANIAVTSDGGRTWAAPNGARPAGFRSAVIYAPGLRMWIATGPSGSDLSTDNGMTWKSFDKSAYNALSIGKGGGIWAVGPKGKIARLGPR